MTALVPLSRRTAPAAVLVCLPCAGGGTAEFRGWAGALPPWLEVAAYRLPGRESRLSETPVDRLEPLADAVAADLARLPASLTVALLGHSFGALVAYEAARRWEMGGRPPLAALIAIGCRAPQLPNRRPELHALPAAELVEHLRVLDGSPDGVLGHPELMALLEPAVRADLAAYESYRHEPGPLLRSSIVAVGGLADSEVEPDEVTAWRACTLGRFDHHVLDGGHFALRERRDELLALVAAAVARGALDRFINRAGVAAGNDAGGAMPDKTDRSNTSKRAAASGGPFEAQRRLTSTATELLTRTQEAQRAAWQEWASANEAYARRMRELAEETASRQSDAYQTLLSRIPRGVVDDAAMREAREAYDEALQAARSAAEDAQRRYEEATRELAQASTRAIEAASQASRDAYRDYLQAYRDEVSKVDVEAVADLAMGRQP